jgi:hypothetical protein
LHIVDFAGAGYAGDIYPLHANATVETTRGLREEDYTANLRVRKTENAPRHGAHLDLAEAVKPGSNIVQRGC